MWNLRNSKKKLILSSDLKIEKSIFPAADDDDDDIGMAYITLRKMRDEIDWITFGDKRWDKLRKLNFYELLGSKP